MNFFKANSYDIVKIYITQFGIAIFSTMLYLSAGMINADNTVAWWISLIISIFATVFFFSLLYCSAWEWGGKDTTRWWRMPAPSPKPTGRRSGSRWSRWSASTTILRDCFREFSARRMTDCSTDWTRN